MGNLKLIIISHFNHKQQRKFQLTIKTLRFQSYTNAKTFDIITAADYTIQQIDLASFHTDLFEFGDT